MTFINFKRALRPQSICKFHFHESTVFSTLPQTKLINNVILKNNKNELITKKEEDSLQRSFDTIIKSQPDDVFKDPKSLIKLYSRIYRPFLSKNDINIHFNDNSIQKLKSFIMKHIRMNSDAIDVFNYIYHKPMFDFGIIRGSYYPSLGIIDDYSNLLKNANNKIFNNHMNSEFNYSSPLSSNFKANEELLIKYLRKSSQLHNGTSNLKNFLVIDNPNQSEFFISLAMRLNINIIVLTQSNFILPSSTIGNEVKNYQIAKKERNLEKCQEIHNGLMNMKLISMRSMIDFMQFLDIMQDPYLRLYQMNGDVGASRGRLDSFDRRLLEMELSILGDVETKNGIRYKF